jgi:predicted GNAT family N-acyltransferase
MLIRSVLFDPHAHDASDFDCGVHDYNEWLRRSAANERSRGSANTFVWTAQNRVLGYYTLTAHVLIKDDLPASIARGGPEFIPCTLLGKLALDVSLQGGGGGAQLLLDALARAVQAANEVAAKLVILDADNGLVNYYRKHGFELIQNSNRRMFIKLSSVRKSIEHLDLH